MKYLKCILFIISLTSFYFTNPVLAEQKKFVASIGNDGVQRVAVVGDSYFFDPNYIIVKVNVPLEMKLSKKPGIILHNFTLKAPEAGIDIYVPLRPYPTTVKFTPTKTGRYPFYCSYKFPFFESHREKGMEGVLEVVK